MSLPWDRYCCQMCCVGGVHLYFYGGYKVLMYNIKLYMHIPKKLYHIRAKLQWQWEMIVYHSNKKAHHRLYIETVRTFKGYLPRLNPYHETQHQLTVIPVAKPMFMNI